MNFRHGVVALTMSIWVTFTGWLVFSQPLPSANSSGSESKVSRVLPKNRTAGKRSVLRSSSVNMKSNEEIAVTVSRIKAALISGDAGEIDQVLSDLLPELIGNAPSLAADLAESLESGRWRVDMLRRVAQEWADRDLVGAQQWAERLPEGEERSSVLTDLCFQMARSDPRKGVEQAEQYGLAGQPGELFGVLLQQWAAKDPNNAADWVKEHSSVDQQDRLIARIALVLADTSPAEAVQMILNDLPAGDAQTESAMSVLHQWAGQDQQGARAWVELFPDGELRERALSELQIVEQYFRR
jgi:hypothetical protein